MKRNLFTKDRMINTIEQVKLVANVLIKRQIFVAAVRYILCKAFS